MKFIVKKDSEIGKKLQVVVEKMNECFNAQVALSEEIGFDEWRGLNWVLSGGISSVLFKQQPDMGIWKNVNGSKTEYMPKKSTKQGKEIAAKFEALPTIPRNAINKIIGFQDSPFRSVGFNSHNEEFFAILLKDEWDFTPPPEFEEITTTKYNQLFKKEE